MLGRTDFGHPIFSIIWVRVVLSRWTFNKKMFLLVHEKNVIYLKLVNNPFKVTFFCPVLIVLKDLVYSLPKCVLLPISKHHKHIFSVYCCFLTNLSRRSWKTNYFSHVKLYEVKTVYKLKMYCITISYPTGLEYNLIDLKG